MLGQGVGEPLERYLQQLVEQEVIEPLPGNPLSSQGEYRFRHALTRDAAYGLVPEGHLPTAHRLAGAWLEQRGEPDMLVLATHHQLGQQLERVASCYTRAAEQFFERHDLPGVLRCVEGALACGVRGELLTRLRALQAVTLVWMDQLPRAVEIGGSVVDALKAGSPLWCRLMGWCLVTGYLLGENQEWAAKASESLLSTSPEPEALTAYTEALSLLGGLACWAGLRPQAEVVLARIVEVSPAGIDPFALLHSKEQSLCFFEAAPWRAYIVAEQATRELSVLGMERNAQLGQSHTGFALAALGELPRAVELLRKTLADTRRTEQLLSLSHVRHYLSHVLLNSSEPAHQQEGHALVREWSACDESDDFRRGTARTLLARSLLLKGELREAETHARQACEFLSTYLTHGIYARTVLGSILLGQGRATEARQVAELGVRDLERMRSQGVFAVAMYLALAEACFAQGDTGAGEDALREGLRCVRARASDIPEPAARERFLRQVPENARTLALARQRWGEATV